MFRRRKARKGRSWGGTLKFATRYPGGSRATQIPMPQTFFTKHAFYLTQNVGGAPAFSLEPYQMNALFNVDLAGGDAGFAAEMSLFYGTYVVLGFSYVVTFLNLETGTGSTVVVVPWPKIEDPTTLNDIEYRAGAKSRMINALNSGSSKTTLKGYVNLSKLYGMKIANEASFWGVGTADPAIPMQFYIGIAEGAGGTQNYQLRVHFTFYVKWFNRNEAGGTAAAVGVLGSAGRGAHIEKLKAHIDNMEKSAAVKKVRGFPHDCSRLCEDEEKIMEIE